MSVKILNNPMTMIDIDRELSKISYQLREHSRCFRHDLELVKRADDLLDMRLVLTKNLKKKFAPPLTKV